MKKAFLLIFSLLIISCLIISCGSGEPDSNTDSTLETESDSPLGVTVSFDSNGGTEIRSQYIQLNTSAFDPGTPIRKGYVFVGWFFGDEKWDFSKSVSADMTLVAKWDVAVGTSVGSKCASYELNKFSKDGVLVEKVDPTKAGKLTVINFWGVWCGPCKSELPDFDQIAGEYKDSIVIYAIHSEYNFAGAPAYVESNYPNANVVFLKDEAIENSYNEVYMQMLGGNGSYPYTVIIDENGIILYKQTGIMSHEQLKSIIEENLK